MSSTSVAGKTPIRCRHKYRGKICDKFLATESNLFCFPCGKEVLVTQVNLDEKKPHCPYCGKVLMIEGKIKCPRCKKDTDYHLRVREIKMKESFSKELKAELKAKESYNQVTDDADVITYLNRLVEDVLEKHRDKFPIRGFTIENFPRPTKIPSSYLNDLYGSSEKVKKLKMKAKKMLEQELTHRAFEKEGGRDPIHGVDARRGIDSILKKLTQEIREKFKARFQLLDAAAYRQYVDSVEYYFEKEGDLPRETRRQKIYDTLSKINQLKKFDFDVSGFVWEIIDKYKRMSPRVELSSKLVSADNRRKVYQITLKNLSLVPINHPELEVDVHARVDIAGRYYDGCDDEIVEKKYSLVHNTYDFPKEKEDSHYGDISNCKIEAARHIELKCVDKDLDFDYLGTRDPHYFCVFELTIPNLGPVACKIKVKANYQEKFLNGKKVISLKEEIESDNY